MQGANPSDPDEAAFQLTQINAVICRTRSHEVDLEHEEVMATPTLIVHAEAGADGEARIRLAARLAC